MHPFLLIELKSLSIKCLSLFVEQLAQRIMCVNRCFIDNFFCKKNSNINWGAMLERKTYYEKTTRSKSKRVFLYIYKLISFVSNILEKGIYFKSNGQLWYRKMMCVETLFQRENGVGTVFNNLILIKM